ncbi:MAG: TrkA C-terminal domain-containing protein [Candidatus Bathyarchaeia archaeon]
MSPKLEKIEYKPVPVRELLLEMKNLSELMIDLAYFAVLYNDRELAEEVLELELRVDTLAYMLDMVVMIAARDAEDAEALTGVTMVAAATDKISDAAADIAIIILKNIGIHPVLTEIFEKTEERLAKVKLTPESPFGKKKLWELDLASKTGVDIIAIRRNKEWIINPKETEETQNGDVLIARGTLQGIKEFKETVEGKRQVLEGFTWTKVAPLREKQFEEMVNQFVELKDTSELMINLAYSSLILNSKELAEEVQRLEEYMDELHTTFELHVLSIKAEGDDPRGFLGLIRLGIVTEKIADAAAEIAEVVLRGIDPHPILKIAIHDADETVAQALVTPNSQLVNKTLKEAKIPQKTGMWVLALRRGAKCIRPKPETKIEAGDVLIASGYARGRNALKKMAST